MRVGYRQTDRLRNKKCLESSETQRSIKKIEIGEHFFSLDFKTITKTPHTIVWWNQKTIIIFFCDFNYVKEYTTII